MLARAPVAIFELNTLDRIAATPMIVTTIRIISATSMADPVVTVRIGLLVRATQGNLPELADPVDFIVLDKLVEAGSAPLDVAAVRRLFITTVRARNYTWESI